MRVLRLVTLALLGAVLASCASNAELPSIEERMADRGYLIGPGDQRIPRYRINSWSAVDDNYVVVRSGVRDEYLIELLGPCIELDGAFVVGFTTPTTRVDKFADLIVTGPGRRERCSISDIYLLSRVD